MLISVWINVTGFRSTVMKPHALYIFVLILVSLVFERQNFNIMAVGGTTLLFFLVTHSFPFVSCISTGNHYFSKTVGNGSLNLLDNTCNIIRCRLCSFSDFHIFI